MNLFFKKSLISALLGLFGIWVACAYADEYTTYADDYWLDWEEENITAFPAFDPKAAIEVEIDPQSQLSWFIDPKTITIGKDSVVRYVVFAKSKSGTVNGMYEGVLCAKNNYKIYARAIGQANQGAPEWRAVSNPEWRSLKDTQEYSHERILARRIMCDGAASPNDVRTVIKKLRNPYEVSPNPANY